MLALFPKPEGVETAFCSVDSPDKALELFSLMRERVGTRMTAFELMPRFGIDLQLKHGMLAADPAPSMSPWYALVEISRPVATDPGPMESALEAAIERNIVTNAAIAQSEAQRQSYAFGSVEPEGTRVHHDLTQEELAQLVGASRETVNKALADFASRGWVRVDSRALTILDAERLARRAR